MFKNKRVIKSLIVAGVLGGAILTTAGACDTEADTVNENISKSAEQFEIQRNIIFYNGITDKIVATVEGRCSIERDAEKLLAVCKVGENQFTRDELGLSDNMTYFSIQTETADVNSFRKRVIIKPQGVIPDFDIVVG